MEGRRCSSDGCNGDEEDGAVDASCVGSSMAAIFILLMSRQRKVLCNELSRLGLYKQALCVVCDGLRGVEKAIGRGKCRTGYKSL